MKQKCFLLSNYCKNKTKNKLFTTIEAKMHLAIKLLRKPDEKINFFAAIEAKIFLAIKLLRKPHEKITFLRKLKLNLRFFLLSRLVTGSNTVQTYARTGYLGFLRRTEAIGSDGGQATILLMHKI